MQNSSFKIYNASAGSGKTHTLTKEYLKIILSKKMGFRKILALTFTNKAVNEMKTRILDSLFEFSSIDDSSRPSALFNSVSNELGLSAEELQERAADTLKLILHNYAFFDISTIDKFTHRIIRTFAKDLGIPQNFEVVLDTDLLLDEAVGRVLQKAGNNDSLTKVLLEFALEKIDDDRSWDVSRDLLEIGKLIFSENHAYYLENYRHKSINEFLDFKKGISDEVEKVENEMVLLAENTMKLINENGLEFTDFTGAYFPKFISGIAQGDVTINFDAGWKQNFETAVLYKKSTPEHIKSLLEGLHGRFAEYFQSIKKSHYRLLFLKNIYRNIVPLTLLNTIAQEVKQLQKERDQLLISEFNYLISKEIKNQPAPFIYERLGEKYRHYFIDEFQDTSVAQWRNLIPLIANALEGEDLQGNTGTLFLVGDAKQAIYRWRGGRAEQFIGLMGEQERPFAVPSDVYSLPNNYRSHAQIIEFNNEFFSFTSQFLNFEGYRLMFEEGNKQGLNKKDKGYVNLHFLEADDECDIKEFYGEQVGKTIVEIVRKGYEHRQICILVRSNRDGVFLADYLTQQKVPTISSESLLLRSSEKVAFLINLLIYAGDFVNKNVAYQILDFLSPDDKLKHQFIDSHLNRLSEFLLGQYQFDLARLLRMSVYDAMEWAIKQFDLVGSEGDAYLIFFLDIVYEVEIKEGFGITKFLDYWDKKSDKLSIAAPEDVNAVTIMTVHKSKGLEFPFVIFPFANENLYKRGMGKKMWLPFQLKGFEDFSEVLVNEKKEILEYGKEAANIYESEEHLMELDAFNVLYVALTRAEKALYIITEKDLTKSGDTKNDYYSGLFITYLQYKGLWKDDLLSYSFGNLLLNEDVKKTETQQSVNFIETYKDREAFRIMTQSGMLWNSGLEEARDAGNQLHYILGLIETEIDIEKALQKALASGAITSVELDEISRQITSIVNHPQLKKYFQPGAVIKNEKDIITAQGEVLRPDRIVLIDQKATLIDYKTGKTNVRYAQQLYRYSDALEQMGLQVENRILVYINEMVQLEFV